MKSLAILSIFLLFVTISSNLFSQEIKYSDLNGSKRPKGQFTSYVSKDGAIYKIGDKLKIGVPSSNKSFAFIQGVNVMLQVYQLSVTASGLDTEIKRIYASGTKRSGFFVMIRSKGVTGLSNYNIQLENAIESGEIKSFGMTSDEALSELKKAKDKLDLGLINQAEYDSTKVVLVKYIK